ncbi:DUF6265 family protein [Sphingopyxis solisilvae]|uniref:DUF6265 family protein n=1 Tax=Sphingopyxis solisilvae TaxID=1886788 RepID=UPI0018929851|nr:DUF6265 family protein [Sphingopyxis solisilvae]
MKLASALLAFAIGLGVSPAHAQSLADLAFLEGSWTSNRSGFVIEENWTSAEAGVVIGMSRGTQDAAVRFLRFAVVEQKGDAVVMRFKRYHSDYRTWETNGPSVMRLASAEPGQAVFEATDSSSDVQRIVYRARADGTIDVTANRADEKGPYLVEFSLSKAG